LNIALQGIFMGFLGMFLDYIINGKFSVIFHNIMFGGFLSALIVSFLRSLFFQTKFYLI